MANRISEARRVAVPQRSERKSRACKADAVCYAMTGAGKKIQTASAAIKPDPRERAKAAHMRATRSAGCGQEKYHTRKNALADERVCCTEPRAGLAAPQKNRLIRSRKNRLYLLTGSSNQNTEPTCFSLSTPKVALCSSRMDLTMLSPSPLPTTRRLSCARR